MSKESYVRGFVKSAESHGVDPVALAKFAQHYKTDGYVPKMTESFQVSPTIDIPEVFTRGEADLHTMPWRANFQQTSKSVRSDDYGRLLAKLDPRFAAWSAAHTNAATKALAPLIKAKYPYDKEIPRDHFKMLEKIYHDEMKRTTSAPPVSVTSQLSITK